MSPRQLLGVFQSADEVLTATKASKDKGYSIVDVFTPYAVHGLDKAMGLRPSRLPWVSLALGMTGAVLKVWFEFWTSAVSWPINVGGKPWNSLPAFVPVTFEVMVLFAGISTVLAFIIVSRLYPGRKAVMPHPDITSHNFVIVLEENDAAFDVVEVRNMFESMGAAEVLERVVAGEDK